MTDKTKQQVIQEIKKNLGCEKDYIEIKYVSRDDDGDVIDHYHDIYWFQKNMMCFSGDCIYQLLGNLPEIKQKITNSGYDYKITENKNYELVIVLLNKK